jgi:uncharacterized protein YidB (DUF937 family)
MKAMDSLKTGVAGITEKFTGENPRLMTEVIKLIQNMPDGVSGLIKQFQDKGLGQLITGLTAPGSTQTISPEQVMQGFGSDKINALASASGMSPKNVPEKLANIFPKVLQQLAPIAKMAGKK